MGVGTYIDNRETLSITFRECLERYKLKVTPLKKGAVRETNRIIVLQKDPLANKMIGTIKKNDMADWRDARIASGLSGNTVVKELALISHVFTTAIQEWGMLSLNNPIKNIAKPKVGKGRERRLWDDEEELLLNNATTDLKAFITIAIETAMRRSEIHEFLTYSPCLTFSFYII